MSQFVEAEVRFRLPAAQYAVNAARRRVRDALAGLGLPECADIAEVW